MAAKAVKPLFETGEKVFVPHPDDVYALSTVKAFDKDGGSVSVSLTERGGEQKNHKPAEVFKTSFPFEEHGGLDDMVTLSNLSEADLLYNLKIRHAMDWVYTYTGPVLVAMNPYKKVALYSKELMDKYLFRDAAARFAQTLASEPHVFAMADYAYMNVTRDRRSQAFVITGESGAGKTATTNFLLQYLAAVSTTSTDEDEKENLKEDEDEEETNATSELAEKILSCNPILETFGNARTVRNNNSSRFGKFIKIHFDLAGHITHASFVTYLLEKSRLVRQTPKERNYHVFYQLLTGAFPDEKERWQLEAPSAYEYLNPHCHTIDGVSDKDDFGELKQCFSSIGLDEQIQDNIFRVVHASLLFGNVPITKDSKDEAQIKEDKAINKIAMLLMCDPAKLKQALVTRLIKTKTETYVKGKNLDEAQESKQSACMTLYQRLFDWIVEKINQSVGASAGSGAASDLYIGILDIFGFEIFEHNSFEQFLINFVNEKLQQLFVEQTFKLQIEEYKREGIRTDDIVYVDNQTTLDLIEKKGYGILSKLVDECKVPKGTDESLLQKLHESYKDHDRYQVDKKMARVKFTIVHYSGLVEYEIANWLIKNKDPPFEEFISLLLEARLPILRELFPVADYGGDRTAVKKMGLSEQFQVSLAALMTTLHSVQPHFVRCIKPNDEQKPMTFNANVVMRQVRCLGMLETIESRKRAYPVWKTFSEFQNRYRFLVTEGLDQKTTPPAQLCEDVLRNAEKLGGEDAAEQLSRAGHQPWQIGKTKVFLRDGLSNILEAVREEKLAASCTILQNSLRNFLAKSHLQMLRVRRASAIRIQALARRYFARTTFLKLQAAVPKAAEKRRVDRCMAQKKRLEQQRVVREKAELDRLEKERLEKERLEKERLERERIAREKAMQEARDAAEKARLAREAEEARKAAEAAAEASRKEAARLAEERRQQDEEARRKLELLDAEARAIQEEEMKQQQLERAAAEAEAKRKADIAKEREKEKIIAKARPTGPPPVPPPRSSSLKVETKEGYLKKRAGEKVKKWELRWFSLTPSEVTYSDHKYKDIKGRIKLDDLTRVGVCKTEAKPHCLELVATYRTFVLQAETEELMDQWIMVFSAAIKRLEKIKRAKANEAARKAVLYSGFLQKQGGNSAIWQSRWFVLTPHVLTYSVKKNKPAKGAIKVGDMTRVGLSDKAGKPNVFEIETKTRTFYQQARAEEDLIEWFDALDRAINPPGGPPKAAPAAPMSEAERILREKIRLKREVTAARPEGAAEDLSKNFREGNLTKRGGTKTSWTRRWVTVNSKQLVYAVAKNKTIKGSINVPDIVSVDVNTDQGRNFCFQIVTSYRTFYMYADSQDDMFDWLVAMKRAMGQSIENIRGAAPLAGPPPPPNKEGYMHKVGGAIKSWQKRWFTLAPTQLEYAEKKNKPAKGSIPISEIQKVGPTTVSGKQHVFEVVTPERTYLMYTESAAETAEWISALAAMLLHRDAINGAIMRPAPALAPSSPSASEPGPAAAGDREGDGEGSGSDS